MEKYRLEISNLPGVRFKKNPIFYYWYDEENNIWEAGLSPTDNPDKLYCYFRGYTKEGLFGNINSELRDTFFYATSHEQLSQTKEYQVDTFSEYFDLAWKIIVKKIYPSYFNDIINGYKKFEFRKNDENYQIGDILCLKEWCNNNYTGNEVKCAIRYIITGQELNNIFPNCIDKDYCILGIERIYY